MSLIRENDAQGSLGPYHDGLRTSVVAAWAHWLKVLPEYPLCSRRGRRTNMNEFIVQEVRSQFGDMVGVNIIETKSGRFLVTVEGIVLLFKHVDVGYKPSNYPTRESIAFNKQLPLPGVPKGPRLVIGYQLNALETELTGVFVILLKGNNVMWYYELGKAGGAVIEMFPESPAGPRVVPKRPKESDKKPKKKKTQPSEE